MTSICIDIFTFFTHLHNCMLISQWLVRFCIDMFVFYTLQSTKIEATAVNTSIFT